jgi:hypothetical protein
MFLILNFLFSDSSDGWESQEEIEMEGGVLKCGGAQNGELVCTI